MMPAMRLWNGRFATAEQIAAWVAAGRPTGQLGRLGSSGGSKPGIRDVDHGYSALLARVFGFGRPTISSGILEADGAANKKSIESKKSLESKRTHLSDTLEGLFGAAPPVTIEDELLTVIQVATWMEFGTEDVPARSFIRSWFDENEAKLRQELQTLMVTVISGKRTKEQILEILGQRCVASIQERISAGIAPENSPRTVARKGSSTPLIDTGQLRSSIHYRIDEGPS